MRLSDDEALARLTTHDHGVLATVHATRGADAVPCVYAVVDRFLGVPVDRVKPKASLRLQREANLDGDPRATLLVDHWDRDDWSQLWWVRAELVRLADGDPDVAAAVSGLAEALAARYHQYRDLPFERVLVFRLGALVGWSGGDDVAS